MFKSRRRPISFTASIRRISTMAFPVRSIAEVMIVAASASPPRPGHARDPLLLGPLDQVLLPLRLLACHLFGLDGLHELPAAVEVGDGDVVQCEVEVRHA